ncbi:MAG: hypothetical protein HY298_23060 [Verrucomicrobia bacterium]|nr:hypothetical protein [Verrucomicrobiota bacterium]
MKNKSILALAALLFSTLNPQLSTVLAQGTAFTYQGRLNDNGSPANGTYDLRYELHNDATTNGLLGSPQNDFGVAVSNGLFTSRLDFGPGIFTGDPRWLQVLVRSNTAPVFSVLLPRQRIDAAPYAVFAGLAADLKSGISPTFTGTPSFNAASGPPFNVGSSSLVRNLNADLLDGLDSTAFVLKAGDTMTGGLTINASGVDALTATASGVNGVNAVSTFNNGNGVIGTADIGSAAYGIWGKSANGQGGHFNGGAYGVYATSTGGQAVYANSSSGYAGQFDGAVRINFASPFNKPQLEVRDPSDSGFARVRLQTGTRPLWDIAVGTGVNTTNTLRFFSDGNGDVVTISPQGTLSTKVLTITGGADIAEPFKMSEENLPKGAVVVIDEENPGHLKLGTQPYDRHVAGVISGAGGINTGLNLQQHGVLEGDQPVALSGRVYVQADTSNGAIKPGDLLTTSDTPGHAMKVTDHVLAQGAILGKAMTGLPAGKGLVLVLVTLQ